MRSSVRHMDYASRGNRSDVASIAVTVVSPRMGEHGWPFANVDEFPAADADPLYGSEHVKDLYLRAEPTYAGRFVRFPMLPYSHSVS